MDSNIEKHLVFAKDPEELLLYMYKKVQLACEEGKVYIGWVYTIDPVTNNVVLVNFEDNEEHSEIIMGHCIQSIVMLNENSEVYKNELDSLFKKQERVTLSVEEVKAKQNKLKRWLENNRIPVCVKGDDNEILCVAEALFVEPPYDADNCCSTNEIILGKIQGLIKNMPPDIEQW